MGREFQYVKKVRGFLGHQKREEKVYNVAVGMDQSVSQKVKFQL